MQRIGRFGSSSRCPAPLSNSSTALSSVRNSAAPTRAVVRIVFMGFPAGYSELFLPKLLLHVIFFLGFLRRFISSFFNAIGLDSILDYDTSWTDPLDPPHDRITSEFQSLVQDTLPAIRYKDLLFGEEGSDRQPVGDRCAVCLYEFEPLEEVRRLSNCRHVFHRNCLDRWVEHDQRICPLCRAPLVPDEVQEAFNRRVWAYAEVSYDVSDDFSSLSFISPFLFPSSSPPLNLQVSA